MKQYQKPALAIFAATAWIGLSEFVRNELLFKSYWVDHYAELGLSFPSEMLNNAVWGVWSLAMAILIYVLLTKFSRWHTVALVWFAAFIMMWLVVGNLGVLPMNLLLFAVPLSLLEVVVATIIIEKITRTS